MEMHLHESQERVAKQPVRSLLTVFQSFLFFLGGRCRIRLLKPTRAELNRYHFIGTTQKEPRSVILSLFMQMCF